MARPPGSDDDDLLLRAVRALPGLAPVPDEDRRIAARTTAAFLRRRRTEHLHRWAWRLVPLSVAGLCVSYLVWAARVATSLLSP